MTSTDRFTFYVNPSWRGRWIHTPLLNPWWGNPIGETSLYTKQLFDTYAFDTTYYTITDDITKADMVLLPYPHTWLLRHDAAFFKECVTTAQEAGLPFLVDGLGDIEYPIDIPNAYVLRYGGYRFLPEPGRIQIFPLADDLLERTRAGQLDIRKKGEGKPVVGFAGWAKLSRRQHIRTTIKELPVRLRGLFDERYRACTKGVFWRQKAIKILQRSPLVVFNLRARTSFSGSSKTAQGDQRELREQMVSTILESDYALDVRGDANDSTRLCEILSLGRIPVIVDTERNFPFSDKIDYASFALVVDFRDIEKLPERIAEFHKNISPEHFEQMQKNARDAYVKYFRIDALTRMILEEVKAKLNSKASSG
jgi:glycosyltransferase involved in cell wall biosynthesis